MPMIRDDGYPERGIHATGSADGVNVVIQYGHRHRGSVKLTPDDVVALIEHLGRAFAQARSAQARRTGT
jgi:hypothetical protein